MAQNITIMGASYSDVPAVQLPKTGGGTARFDDASITTATASDVTQGKLFLSADGTITEGTNSGGGSGGDSAWTKVAETSYQVSTTSTSTSTVATWATGHNELWNSNKWVYVRVRDTEGKRNGYFYGSDQFFYNVNVVNETSTTDTTTAMRAYTRYSNDTFVTTTASSATGYGVYADQIDNHGNVRIRKRYNGSASLTINSTYKVEVYLLDPAGGVPIFE